MIFEKYLKETNLIYFYNTFSLYKDITIKTIDKVYNFVDSH